MSTKNSTVVFKEPKKIVLENEPIPDPKPGQFLIKTLKTLISIGTELAILSGEARPDSVWEKLSKFPVHPGYSNVGKVVKVGQGVKEEWIGQRVVTYEGGIHAQYIVSSPENSILVPPSVPDDYATFFALARTAMNGVRRGRVTWGESVAIYGLGIVGQLTVRICHFAGARPVIGLDISQSRLEYLPKSPEVIGVNPKLDGWMDQVKKATREEMVDVLFEVTGNPDVIPEELRILRRQGRFVILSSPRGKTNFDFHDLCNWPSYEIIGAHTSSHPPVYTLQNPWTKKRHTELFFHLIANGELNVEPLITHRESYRKAPELYNMLLQNRTQALGVILDWTD